MGWQIRYRIYRQNAGDDASQFDEFSVELDPDETVLDGVEKIWAFQDRTLTFRHACHHASCGTCGMRVNGVEKLSCVTFIRDVARDGATITVQPLRHFPVISDLVVDMAPFFDVMQQTDFAIIRDADPRLANEKRVPAGEEDFHRYENCIECGLCVSACPIAGTDSAFLGPAALAAIHRMAEEPRGNSVGNELDLADSTHGAWRCHTAFECTSVCPSNVDPASNIMQVRRRIIVERIRQFFRPS